MSLKKTVAIAAAVGAMAAISVPAMALENEFHGSYTFNTILSNFQDGGSGDFNPAFRGQNFTAATIDPATGQTLAAAKLAIRPYGEKRQTNNYFEQRARINYIAKASDDLKLVTHFEINNRFGNLNSVTNTQGGLTDVSGSDLDTDGLNLVTKHVYLDFNLGSNFNAKLGLQPYKDTLKGLFIDADLPAVMTTSTFGAYKLGLGYSRYNDISYGNTRLGDLATDLLIIDNTFTFTKDTKAALSYYFLADYKIERQAKLINTLGLSGETKFGALSLSGFAAMQAGHQKNSNASGTQVLGKNAYYHGYAANVTAKMAVGPGTAKTAFLFASGNNNADSEQNRGWTNTGISSYNDGGMMILARSTANSPTITDRYLRRVVTNIALATLGYDAKLTEKLYANGNVGFAWAPASTSSSLNPNQNAGDFMGTEINLETGYKVYSNLTLRAQAAYAILGSYYKNATLNQANTVADPENPYTMRLLASFAF